MSDRRAIFATIKAARPGALGWTTAEIRELDNVLDRLGVPRDQDPAVGWSNDPQWIRVARPLIGQREIPGPQHNGWIAKGWARLGAGWFNDDETPWCGFFVAHCMDAAGLPYPAKGEFARAAAWASYGIACPAQLGAIGVKKRDGGNHVFFIVGETPDKRFFKALGGNQSNRVNVMDIAKSDVYAIRWPASMPLAGIALPVMPAGTISRNEA
ncbi:TIGR02594 family protein [Sphingomonas sp. LaA6.9]|uniref:TIGR02594 family protein n=1 Tax=Sphingomonas sp. LaA6.9 TaxID=2919914 RepID=UPI001F4F17FA|nr:TIGR02594 family protein [Sphingomonas sp. LaA6.9]MCJ8159903.1 TIGR02594 family protein [Sphingomonas sp. LaA6.9]